MSGKKFDLDPANKPAPASEYHYRRHDAKGRNRETVSYSIKPEYADKMERMAYWDRRDKSEIMDEIFAKYFEGKDFEPVPKKK